MPTDQAPALTPAEFPIYTANDYQVNVHGSIKLKTIIQGVVFWQTYYVVDNIIRIIFGMDMLEAQHAKFDFGRKRILLRHKKHSLI